MRASRMRAPGGGRAGKRAALDALQRQRAFKATRPATSRGRESCYGEVFGAIGTVGFFLLVSYRPLAHAHRDIVGIAISRRE